MHDDEPMVSVTVKRRQMYATPAGRERLGMKAELVTQQIRSLVVAGGKIGPEEAI